MEQNIEHLQKKKKKQKLIYNITQDFYQTMSTHNMKRKDRIVTTGLRTGHCVSID